MTKTSECAIQSPIHLQRQILSLLEEIASSGEYQRLCDIGCGNGEFTLKVADVLGAKEIYGLEKEIPKNVHKKGVWLFQCDVENEKIPLSDNFFDIVLAVEVVEHLKWPDNLLSEVRRILKKDGLFLVSTPNMLWWFNRTCMLLGYMPRFSEASLRYPYLGQFLEGKLSYCTPAGHVKLYSHGLLTKLLEKYGFNAIETVGLNFDIKDGHLLMQIDKMMTKINKKWAAHLIVSARKT